MLKKCRKMITLILKENNFKVVFCYPASFICLLKAGRDFCPGFEPPKLDEVEYMLDFKDFKAILFKKEDTND